MKCSACEKNECEGKYENRDKCVGEQEDIECRCICRITRNEAVLSSALSIGTGVAVAAAGIGLTVVTGGMAALIAGAAIAGSGTSLVFSPIQKYMSKECVTLKESAKEVAIGATIGAITGPIGAIGSIVSKGASTVVQIGVRIVAGSSVGAVTGVLSEGAKAMQGEEVTFKSVTHSAMVGAAVGTIGGASSQIASGVTKPITNEIGKAATRIAVQGSSAAVTDVGVQLVQSGTVNPQKLILNTAGKMALSTTAEVSTSVTRQIEVKIADSHNKKPNLMKSGSKDTKLKEDQAVKQLEKKSGMEKSNSDLQEKIKQQNTKQQIEVQLEQSHNIQPQVSETFNQKLMGAVNSTGLVFNGMLSSFNTQSRSSFESFAGTKKDSKDGELDEEDFQMKDFLPNESLGDTKEDISIANGLIELQQTGSKFQNDHSCLSNSTENIEVVGSDETVPLLVKIDYDLLLDAQDSVIDTDLNQLDLLQFNNSSNALLSSLSDVTFEASLKPTLNSLTTKKNSTISHGSSSNIMDQSLEQLNTLVSKVIASMEDKATSVNEESQNHNKFNDSHTRVDNELVDVSSNVLETSSTYEKLNLISQQTLVNDKVDAFNKADGSIINVIGDANRSFKEQHFKEDNGINETDLNLQELTITEDFKTQNIHNLLKQRAVAGLTRITVTKFRPEIQENLTSFPKCGESFTLNNRTKLRRKKTKLELKESSTFVIDLRIILTALAAIIILIAIIVKISTYITSYIR